ncbi:winged helix-turn-helix transcriptional regulator [Psychrobacillus glaciei]|uniref:Winged helix-turn-helix transcriptional regulator n=1 Tax=Psychrobacillus glaciei TaxID=2283160 RepID=A0A5J6SQH1_9BACI|nr:carbohydrate kinase [Psychrobacillus glaciei]QFG00206.1 winged helix-turn-helix transcriptional regulator [Psychrobacillus glaciei]
MQPKEIQILQYLRKNPYASQLEIADTLNMSRPAVANIISQLIRNGQITGRAYILPEKNEIICIGGANLDRKYSVKNKLQMGTSNPTTSSQSVGGVARNIAENIGRLGHSVRLLSVVGNDIEYQIIEKASSNWMNLFSVEKLANYSTGTYSAVLDRQGEMLFALANMEIYDQLSVEYMKKQESHLSNAQLLIVDMNCPKEVIEYLQTLAMGKNISLAIIPVSSPKMERMPDNLHGIEWIILNRDEAEAYLHMKIIDESSWKKAAQTFVQKGVNHVVITNGSQGVMYSSESIDSTYVPAMQVDHVVDVTGAGDAFVSGTLHAWLEGNDLKSAISAGMLNASKTLQSAETVRTELSKITLNNELEEYLS